MSCILTTNRYLLFIKNKTVITKEPWNQNINSCYRSESIYSNIRDSMTYSYDTTKHVKTAIISSVKS